MAKVVTMGEIMLRLSTPNNEKFIQADEFDINYGGGEANVAVSLANYGHEAEFVTAVPDNEIGECAVAALRKYNVKTDNIARCGERLGIYYLESGSAMRPSKVLYDRAHSSISTATAADFDFDKIFEGADWFHFTGITPAVSDSAAVLTEEALKAAKRHGVKVSVDLNFRKKLWSSEKAQKVMKNLMQYVDVCIGNEEDAELVLGYKPGNTDVTSGELELAGYKSIFEQTTILSTASPPCVSAIPLLTMAGPHASTPEMTRSSITPRNIPSIPSLTAWAAAIPSQAERSADSWMERISRKHWSLAWQLPR